MADDRQSGFEWRRKRGMINRALERIEDIPVNLLARGAPLTNSAKRRLYEVGVPGRAHILKAPGKVAISKANENLGRFHVRVEVPGRDPYEVAVTQSFEGGYESAGFEQGALVECRVDPHDQNRVLLLAPERDERRLSLVDSSQILSRGHRAHAIVRASEDLGVTAPGTEDQMYLLGMELRSSEESAPWSVEIGQRVPKGAEGFVRPGAALTVAYLEVDDGATAAVDWADTTGGRFR